MPLVLMVCTGNSCRSPMAEGLLRHRWQRDPGLEVASAGIAAHPGGEPSPEAVIAAGELGVTIRQHRARRVDAELLSKAAVVVAMGPDHAQWLRHHFPQYAHKVTTLGELARRDADFNVADPMGLSLENYRQTARDLDRLLAEAERELRQRLGVNPFDPEPGS